MRLLVTLLVLAGCAKGGKKAEGPVDPEDRFQCKDRSAEYAVTGTIVGPLAGVRMTCEGDQPTVEEYTAGEDGVEEGKRHVIDSAAWERSWKDLESLGWARVSDCADAEDNRKAATRKGKKPPMYMIQVRDADAQISITCRGETLVFPYLEMREAIDRAAQEGRESEGREFD
jgi:hypothetical protein